MTSFPAPTRDHHQQFCANESWLLVRDAKGRAVAHHVTYELVVFDGRILRTRISRPVDRTTYGKSMWSAILRDQLDVDVPVFWACVLDGSIPDRGAPQPQPQPQPPTDGLPLALVNTLKSVLGLAETQIAGLTKKQAIEALQKHWGFGADS